MRERDLALAAELTRIELDRCVAEDWEQRAGDLTWSCRRTLDHVVDTLLLYAASVAQSTRSREAWAPIRNGNPGADIPTLLRNLTAGAAILEAVCLGVPDGSRAFHPSGLSDISGFRAMACSEILTHTNDILTGLGRGWTQRPNHDLCDRVIERDFPWAPDHEEHGDRWEVLLWACGRMALPCRPRLDDQWWWHAAPLSEWDGARKERTTPPAWT